MRAVADTLDLNGRTPPCRLMTGKPAGSFSGVAAGTFAATGVRHRNEWYSDGWVPLQGVVPTIEEKR